MSKTCTCEYISPGAAALHASFHGISGLPKLTNGCPLHGIRCPECGSLDCRKDSYDFGVEGQTGYHNSGVRGICRKCGHNADIEDFQQNHRIKGGGYIGNLKNRIMAESKKRDEKGK